MLRDDKDGQAYLGETGELAILAGDNGSTLDRLKSGANNADAVAVGTAGLLRVVGTPYLYNGTSWDRQRGTVETGSLITITNASVNGADQTNYNARGVVVVIDITAWNGTGIVFTVQGKDPTSGKYYTLVASASLAATATTILRVYPGLTAAGNLTVSDVLPRTWRVITTANAITSVTATCAGILLP